MSEVAPQTNTPAPAAPQTVVSIMDAAAAKAEAAAAGTKPPETKPPEASKSKAEIQMDSATLKRLTKLERTKREYEVKIRDLEASSKDAAQLAEVKRLYADGKKMEAVAKLSGADATKEMEDLLAAYLGTDTPAVKDELATKVDALAKEYEADKQARQDERKKQQDTQQQERDRQAQQFASLVLNEMKDESGSPQFELCSRPENRADAYQAALEGAAVLAEAQGLAADDLTPDVVRELLAVAYGEVETEFENIGKRFVKANRPVPQHSDRPTSGESGPPSKPQTRPSVADPGLSRSGISTQSPKRWLNHNEAVRKAEDRARSNS